MIIITKSLLVNQCDKPSLFRKEVKNYIGDYDVSGGIYFSKRQMIILAQGEVHQVNNLLLKIQGTLLNFEAEYTLLNYSSHFGFSEFNFLPLNEFSEFLNDDHWVEKRDKLSSLFKSLSLQIIKESSCSPNMSDDVKNSYLSIIPDRHKVENLQKIVKNISINRMASFSNMMWYRKRFRFELNYLFNNKSEFILEDKTTGMEFADILGLSKPIIFQDGAPMDDLILCSGRVVKPSSGAGSNGVFLIENENRIVEVKTKNILTSIDSLKDAMSSFMIEKNKKDSWIVEELIRSPEGGLPNDYKFYCFYGQAPIVLEVSRHPENRYHWHDTNNDAPDMGMYSDSRFAGTRIEKEYIDLAQEISLKIPAPYVRIDFFPSERGLIFGEFTLCPGLFHGFSDEADLYLGRHLIKAEARLFNDLRNGKKFNEFDSLIKK